MINLLIFIFLIGLGVSLHKSIIVSHKGGSKLERFILNVLLPLFIFQNIIFKKINLDIDEQQFIYSYLMGSVIAFCLSLAINRQSTRLEQIMRGYSIIQHYLLKPLSSLSFVV